MRIFSLCELRNSNPVNDGANVTLVSKRSNEKGYQEDLEYKPKNELESEQEANDSFVIAADGRVWKCCESPAD